MLAGAVFVLVGEVMSAHVRVWDLLQAIRSKLGSDARRQIALAIGVEPRAVDYWFQEGPRARLRGTHLEALVSFAISLGIDPRQFEAGSPLWCLDLPFADQVQYDPGPHPEHLDGRYPSSFAACWASAQAAKSRMSRLLVV